MTDKAQAAPESAWHLVDAPLSSLWAAQLALLAVVGHLRPDVVIGAARTVCDWTCPASVGSQKTMVLPRRLLCRGAPVAGVDEAVDVGQRRFEPGPARDDLDDVGQAGNGNRRVLRGMLRTSL